MKSTNRLYVVGFGKHILYTLAPTMALAKATLGDDCRVPNSDDIRAFWEVSGLSTMSVKERLERLGISRQTLHYWRKKGGGDLPRRVDLERILKERRIIDVIKASSGISAKEAAALAKSTPKTVRRVAEEHGLKLTPARRMPSDEKLIELSAGRTWREFADVVGLRMATLRNYIYRNKALAAEIRKVRKPATTGMKATRKLNLKKVKQMGQKGMTAYAIAEALRVEQMTIRAHLMRWGKEKPNDYPPPYGKRLPPGNSVDSGNGGNERQPERRA